MNLADLGLRWSRHDTLVFPGGRPLNLRERERETLGQRKLVDSLIEEALVGQMG